MGQEGLVEIEVDPNWINLDVSKNTVERVVDDTCNCKTEKLSSFVKNIVEPINVMKGNELRFQHF